jgi:hypothetical protein
MWGDFSRVDDGPLRRTEEGPSGRVVGAGLFLLILGLAEIVMARALYFSWFSNTGNPKPDENLAYLWIPGLVMAVVGVGAFAWGWWRNSHAD